MPDATPRRYTLGEYETRTGVELTAAELALLPALLEPFGRPSAVLGVAPSALGGPRTYDLTATSWVGVLDLGATVIEIRPKLPVRNVFFLLAYAIGLGAWQGVAAFQPDAPLLEAVVPGFVSQVGGAIGRGLLHGYRVEEDALPTVRGRLRFEDQLRRRYGRFPPAEVRYEEFTADVTENRLLKAAIARLARLRRLPLAWRGKLHGLDAALDMVSLVDYAPGHLPDVPWTRLNTHYRPAVELARLILRSSSLLFRPGGQRGSAFLVDMNRVFETFLVIALREALGLTERTFPQGAAGRHLYLDARRSIALKPDLSWWDGPRCVFVGDAKYKRLQDRDAANADLYQLLAYTVAAGLPGGVLVYAEPGQPRTHCIPATGKALHVTGLDLTHEPAAILGQIAGIAARIRQLRMSGNAAPLAS